MCPLTYERLHNWGVITRGVKTFVVAEEFLIVPGILYSLKQWVGGKALYFGRAGGVWKGA